MREIWQRLAVLELTANKIDTPSLLLILRVNDRFDYVMYAAAGVTLVSGIKNKPG